MSQILQSPKKPRKVDLSKQSPNSNTPRKRAASSPVSPSQGGRRIKSYFQSTVSDGTDKATSLCRAFAEIDPEEVLQPRTRPLPGVSTF